VLQNTKKARAGVGIVLIKDAIGLEPENRKGARSYATVANQSAEHAVAAADDSVRLREVRENLLPGYGTRLHKRRRKSAISHGDPTAVDCAPRSVRCCCDGFHGGLTK
jgi:hypothetical protein